MIWSVILTSRLLFKLFLFVLPFVLVLAVLTGVLIYTGESMPLAWVVERQMDGAPLLYRPQYGSQDVLFKTLSINKRQPDVVTLGSSRVLQFRAGLLTENPNVFYNAGGPAWGLEQVREVLDNLTVTPEVLILGMDAPWFNAAYSGDEIPPVMDDFSRLFAVNRSVMQSVIDEQPVDLSRLLARQNPGGEGRAFGIKAIMNGHGFRNDGSELYGDFLVGRFLHQPTERQRHLEWMQQGQEMYVYGAEVDENALAELEAILKACQERGITVIGFMPPFSPSLYQAMKAAGNHTYMDALMPRLETVFSTYDFQFFDFSDGRQLGIDDDFYDGWHGSERVYLRLYTRMVAAAPEILGQYSNQAALEQIDAGVTDTWRVFGDPAAAAQ